MKIIDLVVRRNGEDANKIRMIVIVFNVFIMALTLLYAAKLMSIMLYTFCEIVLLLMFSFVLRAKLKTESVMISNYKKENEELKTYIKTVDEFNSELRRFKHNYQNILGTLYGYIQDTTNDELKKYFSEIVDECKKIKNINVTGLSMIKSIPLKSLLTIKLNKAIDKKILFYIYYDQNVEEDKLPIKDICEILGVFLDNAIEENCKSKIKNKKIEVYICKLNNSVIFNIKNRYLNAPRIINNTVDCVSTKGKDRGFGIKSIKRILERYKNNMLLNTYIEENEKMFVEELIFEET